MLAVFCLKSIFVTYKPFVNFIYYAKLINMTQIQESDIKNIANLARINLTEDEVVKFTKDIQSIVGFIDMVNNTEVSDDLLKQEGFAPLNTTREDTETQTNYMTNTEIINSAPNHQDNAVKVKKIIGGSDDE